MKAFSTGIILTLYTLCLSAQNDTEAIRILDRFSQTALAAPSVSMKFDLETIDQIEGTEDKMEGHILMSNDRYRLELPDNTIWFNGITSWNYLPAEKEVTITEPDKKDESFLAKPSGIFKIYKKDYKVRLLEEKANSCTIDLYPEKLDSDHVRIRLSLTKPGLELQGAEYKYKNGVTIILTVKEYNLKQTPGIDAFTFQPEKYKGVEIIDMR